MSRYSKFIAGGALSLAVSGALHAQSTTQSVAIEVQAINQISVAGSPSLTINTAVAGSEPTQATSSGTYAITTNQATRKITIEINSNMPAGVTLTAALTAPAGGTSAGALTLSTTPQDAVTGITKLTASGLAIAYTLDATVAAGVISATTRNVLFTIVAGP